MQQEKRKFIISILIILLITSMILLGGYLYIQSMEQAQQKQSDTFLYEVAVQSTTIVEKEIQGNLNTLRALANFIGEQGSLDPAVLLPTLEAENDQNEFRRMGYSLLDGTSYAVDLDGTVIYGVDFSQRDYVQHALAGEAYVSDTTLDTESGIYFNAYAAPVYRDGQVIAALIGIMQTDAMRSLLEVSTFNGSGFCHIARNDGKLVVRSAHPNADQSLINLFDPTYDTPQEKQQMQQDMLNGRSGQINYTYGGVTRRITYVPMSINNWYIISVVPLSSINQYTQGIVQSTLWVVVAIVAAFIAFTIYTLRIRNRSRKHIFRLAYYDGLTGCYNRNKFILEAQKRVGQGSKRQAVAVLNVNHFNAINEMFGYSEGDQVLRQVARVLGKQMRAGEVYARTVADDFVLLLEYEQESELIQRIQAMMEDISAYRVVDNFAYYIVCRSGVYPLSEADARTDMHTLVDRARFACNMRKGLHESTITLYDEKVHLQQLTNNEIENDMREGLRRRQFQIYLQPKYSVAHERIVGAEALVRWQHPKKGLLAPDAFVPIFEANGFITELDLYMLERVCEIQKRWLRQGKKVFPISVNQSRMLLYKQDYVERVQQICHDHAVPAALIELELTESAVFENQEVIVQILDQLHALGFLMSMDDFGSGYSSLNLLKDIRIDELKLDRIFFRQAADTRRGRLIVSSMIAMAKELGITTVAEGIETLEQLEFLQEIGCEVAQGFYFSRPIPLEEFEALAFTPKD